MRFMSRRTPLTIGARIFSGKIRWPTGEPGGTFGKHDRAHHWDLRIEDEKGNSLTLENLDLMSISEVVLHYKDGKAWADLK